MISDVFFWLMIICSLAGTVSAIVLNKHAAACIKVSFGCAIVAALMGVSCALAVLAGETFTINILQTTIFDTYAVSLDPLGGLFLLIISMLVAIVSFYSIDYQKGYMKEYSSGWMGAFYNAFYLSMVIVVSSSNVILFFIAWEAMSAVSYFLVVYERNKKESLSAGLTYIIMMQAGTVFILIGLFIMTSVAGSFDYNALVNVGALMPADQKNWVFVFLLIGFGMKAGIVPLHVWLPLAHPEAPSNVSALMSGVMIKVAVFMFIKTVFGFLGIGTSEIWWGLLILIVGCLSAILGVLYGNVEKDMKRMLAFSSVENIGIIFIGIGTSMVFKGLGLGVLASISMIAALLHAFNHALFKGLLFMGAGSVLHATHTKHMEDLGGLVKLMPRTSVWFFIGVLSISAIPPFNGFVSEWLMFQSLMLSFNIGLNPGVTVFLSVAIAILALTGGLVIAGFVRAFGTSFLALPRTKHASEAKESPRTMRWAMAIAGIGCILAGILSPLLLPVMDSVATFVIGTSGLSQGLDLIITFPSPLDTSGMTSPLLIGAAMAVLLPVVITISSMVGGKQKETIADTWDCGTPLTPRNEYTATAYSNPINKVFTRVYRHKPKPEMIPSASPYIFKEKKYTANEKENLIENKFYVPLVKGVMKISNKIRTLQSGSISRYIMYIFVVLVILLLFFR